MSKQHESLLLKIHMAIYFKLGFIVHKQGWRISAKGEKTWRKLENTQTVLVPLHHLSKSNITNFCNSPVINKSNHLTNTMYKQAIHPHLSNPHVLLVLTVTQIFVTGYTISIRWINNWLYNLMRELEQGTPRTLCGAHAVGVLVNSNERQNRNDEIVVAK
jgi:hypothetical protein